jgi:hypothetical protein
MRDDGGQPRTKILDPVRARAAEIQPGILNGVVGFGNRSEHPVSDAAEVSPVFFKSFRQPVVRIGFGHTFFFHFVTAVTEHIPTL